MNSIDALKYLLDGQKIRGKSWVDTKRYLTLSCMGAVVDESGVCDRFEVSHQGNEWELYKPAVSNLEALKAAITKGKR